MESSQERLKAYEAHLSAIRQPKTVEAYMDGVKRLEAFHVERGYTQVTSASIEEFSHALLRKGLQPSSVKLYLSAVMSYVRWQKKTGRLTGDIDRPELPRSRRAKQFVPDEKQLVAFVRGARTAPEPVATMLQILPLTGLRVGELCALTKKDVQISRTVEGTPQVAFRVRAEVSKTGEERVVPLHPAGVPVFSAYVRGVLPALPFDPKTQALFPGRRGAMVGTATIRSWLRRIRGRLGIDKMTPHAFRRWYATTLNRHGMNLLDLQSIMGHKSPATTSMYVQQSTEELASKVSKIPMPTTPGTPSRSDSPSDRRKK